MTNILNFVAAKMRMDKYNAIDYVKNKIYIIAVQTKIVNF